MVSFILKLTKICHQRDSSKSQLLRLYSQFSFTKMLKTLHTGFNIGNIFGERQKVLQKIFLIDVDRLTLARGPQDVNF